MEKLRNRGLFTLSGWCKKNGYPGVTKECILSAEGSENKKLRKMAKEARLKNILKEEHGRR